MCDARTGLVRLLTALALCATGPVAFAGQGTQIPGTIRSRVTLVPLDVRVLDRDGRPVTDLRVEDFTILENGIPQTVSHFAPERLAPDLTAMPDTPDLRKAGDDVLTPARRRTFLLVMGRGRMTGPSRELDALIAFVRSRLLPQDQVAVLAYNRATDFTVDHERVASVLSRYKARHTKIEALLAQHFSGLRAVYGSRTIPPTIQREIDEVFAGSDLRPREIAPGQITGASAIAGEARRTREALHRAEILRERPPDAPGLPDAEATDTADRLDLSFDQYVTAQVELMQDLANVYTSIEYLRYLEGEKHIAFVTPRGLSLPRAEDDFSLAAAAADARVVLNIVYTGGVVGAPPPRFIYGPEGGGRIDAPPVARPAAVFGQTLNVQAMRRIAETTGGRLTAFKSGEYAFSRLDEGTRFRYVLGYYPSDAAQDGRFRRITVRVNRPGVTVSYRRGYYASPVLVPLDRREFLTFPRMSAAGRYGGDLQDIRIELDPPRLEGSTGRELIVAGTVDLSSLRFTAVEGRQTAAIDIGVYCGDRDERLVGEIVTRVDLRLTVASYESAMRDPVPFSIRLQLSGDPRYVKVIVYDYASDLLGTVVAKLPR